MTKEDQDAEIGRLVRERSELRKRQTAIFEQASKAGELLKGVGEALENLGSVPRSRPQISFDPRGVRVESYVRGGQTIQIHGQLPVLDEVKGLVEELRDVEARLAQVEKQLEPYNA